MKTLASHQCVLVRLGLLALLSPLIHQPSTCLAQPTAFTYQGRLNDGANPATGVYDLQFALYDATTLGTLQGNTITNSATAVTNGLFTITLDFGNQFPGANRWLEIGVRTNGGGAFTTLSPRQELTATPYAITAGNVTGPVSAAQVSGILSSGNLPGSPTFGGTVTATSFTGSGASVTDVNAASLNGLSASNFWQLGGNAGTTPDVNFLGTTDNQPLELRVNGARAMRLVACANTVSFSNLVNVVGGSPNNYVAPFVMGATLAGGGALKFGIAAVTTNSINASGATLSGGIGNTITGNGFGGTLAGGSQNTVGGSTATVGGGTGNTSLGESSTVGGGNLNSATTNYSTVSGGVLNSSSGIAATMGGGGQNRVGGDYSVVSGGRQNINDTGNYSVVGGGQRNVIVASDHQTIAGGSNNLAGAMGATIGGGRDNISSGLSATVPGGGQNTAGGDYSFAVGRQAKANHQSAFVWADSPGGAGADFASTSGNQFLIRASGGVGIGTNSPAAALHVVGNILATGTVTGSSDRNLKQDFAPVDGRAVLDKVAALPISTWTYISDDGVRHLGPMAQDFHAAFNVGLDDKTISMVDADGVALAAIQGLNQKLEQKESEITELKSDLRELKQLVEAMNQKLNGGAK